MRRALAVSLLSLALACGGEEDPCKDCTPGRTPDAKAVLDPGEQVLGVRTGSDSERTCAAVSALTLDREGDAVRGTFSVPSWLNLDGLRVLVREGDVWRVARELPASARSFEVETSARVAVQAVRGGLESAPAEPEVSGQGLQPLPPPRVFHSSPQGLTSGDSLEVTLDATRMAEGRYRSTTVWKGTAVAGAAEHVFAADLEPVSVRWNAQEVPHTHGSGELRVSREVNPGESFEVEVVLEHAGDDLDVRRGGILYAHLGRTWAFAASGLRWYAEPTDGSAAATSLDILVPTGTRVAGPAQAADPLPGAFDRHTFELGYAAPALPFALGPFVAARSPQRLEAASLHLPTCATGQAEAWAANVASILDAEESRFGRAPAGALTFVGLDADPGNDPCTAPDSDGDVATVSRPGMIFGPSYLWEGDPTLNTDFFFSHEASHQWWGIVVQPRGVDVWLSEGMADHSAGLYVREARGKEAEREVLRAQLPYLQEAIAAGRDAPVVPASTAQLVAEVFYVKGSWVLRGLEAWMGEERWGAFLKDWAQSNLHTEVGTQEFQNRVRALLGDGTDAYFDSWLRATGLPDVQCADFYDPASGTGRILVHQEPAARFGLQDVRPFVLPLHASAVRGGQQLRGFALIDGSDGVIDLTP